MIHTNELSEELSQPSKTLEYSDQTSKANCLRISKSNRNELNKTLIKQKKGKHKFSQNKHLSYKNDCKQFIYLINTLVEDAYNSDEHFLVEIDKSSFEKLCTEAAKSKMQGEMENIDADLLIKLLKLVQNYVQDGCDIFFENDLYSKKEERKYFIEKVSKAVYASLLSLYIITTNITSKIHLEDVMEQILLFANSQVKNTINVVFGNPKRRGNIKRKFTESNEKLEKCFLFLNQNMNNIINLFNEILDLQKLTDSLILQISSLGVSSFFSNTNALELSSLRLLTNVFSKYEKHRKILMDDILTAVALNKNYSCFKLKMGNEISLLSALLLQLVQSSVKIPQKSFSKQGIDNFMFDEYKYLMNMTYILLNEFIKKAVENKSDVNYRNMFDNLIHDVLKVHNTPEWPIAEVMLMVLGNTLMNNLGKKTSEVHVRLFSLEYLGVIVSHLRKCYLQLEKKLKYINDILEKVAMYESETPQNNNENLKEDNEIKNALKILFIFLKWRNKEDIDFSYAEQCHLVINFNDINNKISFMESRKKSTSHSSSDLASMHNLNEHILQDTKELLLNKIEKYESRRGDLYQQQEIQEYIDSNDINLICTYLSSKRALYQNFNFYLSYILKILTENNVPMRTKAMKCLATIIEIDPTILGHKEIHIAISHSFLDLSPLVREAAVDLIGKYILGQPNLLLNYYDAIIGRILDTGIAVRKRVIKILMDISTEFPDFIKIPEICVKILQRINDEDSIKALVLNFFTKIWFTPVKEKPRFESDLLVQKVKKMNESILNANEISIQYFEKLFTSIFKTKESMENILKASKQIIDCLIEMIIQLEKDLDEKHQKMLGASLTLLYIFSKVNPQLLIMHATTLQPYLTMRYNERMDNKVLNYVIKTMEQIIPLIDHPSEIFMSHLEEDCVKLIMSQDPTIVVSSVSCLCTIVSEITKNYKLVRDFFKSLYDIIRKTVMLLEGKGSTEVPMDIKPSLNRSLFVTGLLIQHFDFDDSEFLENELPSNIKEDVIRSMYYLLSSNSPLYVLKALGYISIRCCNILLNKELKAFYIHHLTDDKSSFIIKIQILNNIEIYLTEEDKKWATQEEKWSNLSKMESLKEINDCNLGMASVIVQNYLSIILESAIHFSQSIRSAAIKVIQLILKQGLVHPLQIVPYLIALSTDEDKLVRNTIEKNIEDIERKYPGYSHTKGQAGVQLSFCFQKAVKGDILVRGYRLHENESIPRALNSFLYSILKTKQQKRALIISLIRQIEESAKNNLPYALYLADHLVYFPYRALDDVLFLVYQIDFILSMCGMNMIEMFEENLIPKNQDKIQSGSDTDDEEESMESIVDRLPNDTTPLEQSINAAQGSLLLGLLKQFIMAAFGITNDRLAKYSPSDKSKLYDKQLKRKNNVSDFNPSVIIQKITNYKENRESLVEQYFLLKSLINDLDPDDFFHKSLRTSTEKSINKIENSSTDKEDSSEIDSKCTEKAHRSRKVNKLDDQEYKTSADLSLKRLRTGRSNN